MAGVDVAKALEYKERGNNCFQTGDYSGAEALYTKAINHDPMNPLFYTNRAMAILKLSDPPTASHYEQVIEDSQSAIRLLPENMKAYYQLAQAQIALHRHNDALESSKTAHRLCVEECRSTPMGKGSSSIGPITELVLRCKRDWWAAKEARRLRERGGLVEELVEHLQELQLKAVQDEQNGEPETRDGRIRDIMREYDDKVEELRCMFEESASSDDESKRRKVPDWCIDDITFAVMLDPVMTKTGRSYDRSSLMEHLRRSSTDPLTREPLLATDLRPNLALKEACAQFIAENGWAVDW